MYPGAVSVLVASLSSNVQSISRGCIPIPATCKVSQEVGFHPSNVQSISRCWLRASQQRAKYLKRLPPHPSNVQSISRGWLPSQQRAKYLKRLPPHPSNVQSLSQEAGSHPSNVQTLPQWLGHMPATRKVYLKRLVHIPATYTAYLRGWFPSQQYAKSISGICFGNITFSFTELEAAD